MERVPRLQQLWKEGILNLWQIHPRQARYIWKYERIRIKMHWVLMRHQSNWQNIFQESADQASMVDTMFREGMFGRMKRPEIGGALTMWKLCADHEPYLGITWYEMLRPATWIVYSPTSGRRMRRERAPFRQNVIRTARLQKELTVKALFMTKEGCIRLFHTQKSKGRRTEILYRW